MLAEDSVSGAQRLFSILEAREIGKLTAVGETLASNVWRPRRDLNPCYRRERAMS